MDAHEAARAPALSVLIEEFVIAPMTALAAGGRSVVKLARRAVTTLRRGAAPLWTFLGCRALS
jgi:hypothetical protein